MGLATMELVSQYWGWSSLLQPSAVTHGCMSAVACWLCLKPPSHCVVGVTCETGRYFPVANADFCSTDSLDIQFWANLCVVEITSSECLSEVQTLLNCPSKITLARSFQGREAQTFIDFLDQVIQLCPPGLLDRELILPNIGPYAVTSQ